MSNRKGGEWGRKPAAGGAYWLCGVHAVVAALDNPARRVRRIAVTRNATGHLDRVWEKGRHPAAEEVDGRFFDRIFSADAVHQGIAAEVDPLPECGLEAVLGQEAAGPLLLLDQVTDPHNVGAILRSAAAFGAAAVVVTRHHAPQESAALAKAACGALELVPYLSVGNLAQAIEEVREAGYWVAGLDGDAKQSLHEAKLDGTKMALVLGAEGKGLRRLTAERCDLLVRLPIAPRMESLNVSNAAAVALYELYVGGQRK